MLMSVQLTRGEIIKFTFSSDISVIFYLIRATIWNAEAQKALKAQNRNPYEGNFRKAATFHVSFLFFLFFQNATETLRTIVLRAIFDTRLLRVGKPIIRSAAYVATYQLFLGFLEGRLDQGAGYLSLFYLMLFRSHRFRPSRARRPILLG